MPSENKKSLSDSYKKQLVNLFKDILNRGQDLDYLINSNKEQYRIDMGKKNVMTEASWKQTKVKMKALKKHSDEIEHEFLKTPKAKDRWNKESLRDYTKIFFGFKPYPEKKTGGIEIKEPPKEKPTKIPIPKRKSQYGVAEIYDIDNDFSYWVKYKNKKDFDDKLGKLKRDSIPNKFNIIPHGIRNYKTFIDEQFREILDGII